VDRSVRSTAKNFTNVAFLDTSVLVYAASGRPADITKARVARSLVAERGHAISLQVLQEFYVAARQPKKLGLSHQEAEAYCRQWRRFTILEPTLLIFDDALALCVRFQLGYYDSAILAAARFLRSGLVYSEDLSDGQDYDGVRVQNPFRGL
jgi:predicted nucleic acid-binding protein